MGYSMSITNETFKSQSIFFTDFLATNLEEKKMRRKNMRKKKRRGIKDDDYSTGDSSESEKE